MLASEISCDLARSVGCRLRAMAMPVWLRGRDRYIYTERGPSESIRYGLRRHCRAEHWTRSPAHADDMWAAIACSTSSPDQCITSWGPLTRAQAEQGSLQSCNKNGITDCQIVASSANCVALVSDDRGVHGGVGDTQRAAVADAQSKAEAGGKVATPKYSTMH